MVSSTRMRNAILRVLALAWRRETLASSKTESPPSTPKLITRGEPGKDAHDVVALPVADAEANTDAAVISAG